MLRYLTLATLALFATQASARQYEVSPANPVALEPVHLQTNLNSCEWVRGVQAVDGGFRINIQTPRTGVPCDDLSVTSFTLGAFPPGTYRLTTRVTCIDCSPSVLDEPEVTTITVTPAPASVVAGDDLAVVDTSGIWTAASEPYTAINFIASGGVDAQGRRTGGLTGLWYDYSGTQPTWTVLLFTGASAQIMRAMPTGTGANRTVTFVQVGTATLSSSIIRPLATPLRFTGTVDGRNFDLLLERFRWTRYAWPAPSNPPQ